MKVAMTGSGGQVASALRLTVPDTRDELEVRWLSHRDLNVADPDAVSTTPALDDIDVIINTAAYTAVDQAETDEELAYAVNAEGPGYLAQRCASTGAHLLHLSTDYVFGPEVARRPLRTDDPTGPVTVYGKSKLDGEHAVLNSGCAATVVRTAWVFSGASLPKAADFVSTMMRMAQQTGAAGQSGPSQAPSVVDDQTGSPTFALDLARCLWEVALEQPQGIRHAVNEGQATWWEVAREVFSAQGADPEQVVPVASHNYPMTAQRPAWSVLRSDFLLPEWRDALRRAVAGSIS